MAGFRLEPILSGNPDGETILFVQGWPDDSTLWDGTVAALGTKYRCARVNMPNYRGGEVRRWGYGTEEIVEGLVELIRRLAKDKPITLVLHDWGCYWGHAAHHRVPELVARVCGVDVSPHIAPKASALAATVAYQSWLAAAFFLGGPAGDWMTRRMAKLGGAPAAPENIRADLNYPYRNIWQDLASGRARTMTKGYWPTCPLLFVYGARKPFNFHSEKWVEHVERVGGKVVALPTNHWVPRHPEFVSVLERWLD